MNSKIEARQYLRYMKTFVWAMRQDLLSLTQVNRNGTMKNYPVDANTVEDAINFVETGDCLRDTSVSMTDVYAIMEAVKHKTNNDTEDRNTQTGDGSETDWVSDDTSASGSDNAIRSEGDSKRVKRNRKRKND